MTYFEREQGKEEEEVEITNYIEQCEKFG